MAPMNGFTSVLLTPGWTPELERRLLLPRHALHSAKLAIEGEREWASPLPPDLTEFCSGGL